MDMSSPFEQSKSFRIDTFDVLDERTMEKLFCSGINLSRKNSKMLVSFIKAGLAKNSDSKNQRDAVPSQEWTSVLNSVKSIQSIINKEI
jgi:hypothetical protein